MTNIYHVLEILKDRIPLLYIYTSDELLYKFINGYFNDKLVIYLSNPQDKFTSNVEGNIVIISKGEKND